MSLRSSQGRKSLFHYKELRFSILVNLSIMGFFHDSNHSASAQIISLNSTATIISPTLQITPFPQKKDVTDKIETPQPVDRMALNQASRSTGTAILISASESTPADATTELEKNSSAESLKAPEATGVASPGAGPGLYSFHFEMQGYTRRFAVYVPSSWNRSSALPVLIALHGSGGTPENFMQETRWDSMSETHQFLVIAPEGLAITPAVASVSMVNPRVWNTGEYPSFRERSTIDDSSFIIACLDDVATRWPIDSRQVYVSGYSNGGAMALRLAGERSDRITAVSSVGGLAWRTYDLRRTVPSILVYGTLDPIVPSVGGLKLLPWEVRLSPSVDTSASRWARSIGIYEKPYQRSQADHGSRISTDHYGSAEKGEVMQVIRVHSQGHAWPGANHTGVEQVIGPNLSDYDATAHIWAFLSRWSK